MSHDMPVCTAIVKSLTRARFSKLPATVPSSLMEASSGATHRHAADDEPTSDAGDDYVRDSRRTVRLAAACLICSSLLLACTAGYDVLISHQPDSAAASPLLSASPSPPVSPRSSRPRPAHEPSCPPGRPPLLPPHPRSPKPSSPSCQPSSSPPLRSAPPMLPSSPPLPPAPMPPRPPLVPPCTPSPAPPMLSAARRADLINRRFANGGPRLTRRCLSPPCESDLLDAEGLAAYGVIARLIDPSSDPDVPWLACSKADAWCHDIGDRLPATLLHPDASFLYKKQGGARGSELPGFVVHPDAARLLCSYSSDGSSMSKRCPRRDPSSACIPGCPPRDSPDRWCLRVEDWCEAWAPERLDDMLTQQVLHASPFLAFNSS